MNKTAAIERIKGLPEKPKHEIYMGVFPDTLTCDICKMPKRELTVFMFPNFRAECCYTCYNKLTRLVKLYYEQLDSISEG